MIRKANIKDCKELFILEQSIFTIDDFPMSLSSFYYHTKHNSLFVYEKDGKIIGYILWLKRKKYYRLYSLCVLKEYRRDGIGQKLLDFSFEQLHSPTYTLEVKVTNTNAIKFYEKNNFKIKKVLENFYPNNINGYLMKL